MKPILAFLLLCLLWSMEWLREPLAIFPTPPLLRSALSCTLAALLLAALRRGRLKPTLQGGIWACILLAAPVLLQHWATVSDYTAPVLWTLVPLFIVVLSAAKSQSSGLRFDLLVATCFGSAGSLFIFPFQLPNSPREAIGWLLILLAVAAASGGSLHARCVTAGDLVLPAVTLWIVASLSGSTTASLDLYQLGWIALVDAPALLLLLWLLNHLAPEKLAVRYFLPLVLTIVSSGFVLHQHPSVRLLFGLLLLSGSSLYIFRAAPADKATTTIWRLHLD